MHSPRPSLRRLGFVALLLGAAGLAIVGATLLGATEGPAGIPAASAQGRRAEAIDLLERATTRLPTPQLVAEHDAALPPLQVPALHAALEALGG